MLDQGYPLSQVTEALCARWRPGVRLLPMSDDRVETHVVIEDEAGRRAIHFQEWWVRLHASMPAARVRAGRGGGRQARRRESSTPWLTPTSFCCRRRTRSCRSGRSWRSLASGTRCAGARAPVVGVSPIIGGAPVRGMADACLTALGLETSASAVAGLYAGLHRRLAGLETTEDEKAVPGVTRRRRPLLMSDPTSTRALARAAFDLALELRAAA